MEYFTNTLSNIKHIWRDLIFKFAGNLFPLYLGAFILLIFDNSSLPKLIDAQAFTIYSSTFLFSTMYLWYKNFNKKEDGNLLLILFFIILFILISIIYAALFSDKLTPEKSLLIPSLILFFIVGFLYVFYECIHYEKVNTSTYREENRRSYSDLNDEFDNLERDE